VRAPLVAVALAALGAPAHAGDFDATLAAAKARSVPVIVSFGSASCERCVEFETEVLPTPEVQAALRKAIFVSYDFHGEPGAKLARKYHVTTLPVFLAIDGEGRELLRLSGVARGTEWFVRFVRRARDLGADESSIEAELAGSREKAEVRLKAARWYRSRGRVREAIENYERAIEVAPDQAVAAEAAHDLAKLTAAVERRKRVVSDAVSFVHRFPESRRAAQELAVAVLSGDLGRERREELLRIAAARAPLKSLERVVYTALAAGDTANALLAAQRLAASELDRTQAYLALADAYLGDGDGVAAAQSHQIACREPPVVYREECAEQTRRFSDGGEIAAVAELRREVVSYFAVIEDPAVGVAAAAETMVGDPALAKFIPDMRQRFAAASRRCVKQRRGLDEVWVRLEMAGPKRRPKKVVVLEPGAPRELVDCLTSVLDAPVAVIPSLYRKRFVAPVRFRDDPTTPPEPDYDEPVIRGRMHHAYLYLSGMAGVADTLGAGTRAVVTALRRHALVGRQRRGHLGGHRRLRGARALRRRRAPAVRGGSPEPAIRRRRLAHRRRAARRSRGADRDGPHHLAPAAARSGVGAHRVDLRRRRAQATQRQRAVRRRRVLDRRRRPGAGGVALRDVPGDRLQPLRRVADDQHHAGHLGRLVLVPCVVSSNP
jgi:hypothetical protein